MSIYDKARKANLPKLITTGVVTLNEAGDAGTCDVCPGCRKTFNLRIRSGLWRFKCENEGCKLEGGAIDFMAKESGLSALDAARMILKMQPELSQEKTGNTDKEVERKALYEACRRIFTKGHTSVKEVLVWAKVKFGIKHEDMINLAIDGRLRMMPAGMQDAMNKLEEWGVERGLMQQAGLWKEGNRCPAIAFRQVMLPSRDRRAVEFISIDDNSHRLTYGDFSSPIVMFENPFNPEVVLVDNGIDGLKFLGEGNLNTIWDAPSGSWKQSWFWEQFQANSKTIFNLTRLPEAVAAECAAKLQAKNIPFK